MVRYFGFLANRVCGEKLPQVYRALGMDKPEAVANMTHNGRQFVPLPQRLAVHRRLCVSGYASMSGIPEAVMAGSPPLNVSV